MDLNNKKCPVCLEVKPRTNEHFYTKSINGFYTGLCKPCRIKRELKKRDDPTFRSFEAARGRCNCRSNKDYYNYGQRGIKFKIRSVEEIVQHIGPRPPGKTLDRIDSSGHYELNNIRWVTMAEQQRNRRQAVRPKYKQLYTKNQSALDNLKEKYHHLQEKYDKLRSECKIYKEFWFRWFDAQSKEEDFNG